MGSVNRTTWLGYGTVCERQGVEEKDIQRGPDCRKRKRCPRRVSIRRGVSALPPCALWDRGRTGPITDIVNSSMVLRCREFSRRIQQFSGQ